MISWDGYWTCTIVTDKLDLSHATAVNAIDGWGAVGENVCEAHVSAPLRENLCICASYLSVFLDRTTCIDDLLEELFECTDILIWVLDGADGNCMRDCQGILKKLAASASRSSAFVTSSRAAVVERIRWCCRVALMSAGRRMAGVGTSASALWSRTTTASTSQGRLIKKFNCEGPASNIALTPLVASTAAVSLATAVTLPTTCTAWQILAIPISSLIEPI
ncbi:hypothetical protein O3P69_008407 [Scylla paramamosain]|uniref:Uncharacterized protein n=1 Tax=Scylla paramamosain TaxID=85552 RepID=A0AAW0SJM6_SCYPA